ncbi:MAG: helix-turn-helix domain-containing protein [Planctomycetota bacterium]
MAAKTAAKRQLYDMILLDRAKTRSSRFASLRPHVVSSVAELRNSVAHATRDSLWVSYASDLTESLVRNASLGRPSLGFGLFIHSLDMKTVPALSSFFRRIAFTVDGGFIPTEELAEVLETDSRPDLFIGGSVNHDTSTVTFWRGDLKPLTVPFTTFAKSGTGTKPDFNKFAIIDCGQTVQLGDYEAAVDAILYEFDPDYRRRISKRRLQEDQSFGASLRRLRKQRGLRREDFEPDLSAKTIARIEQGKVTRIQRKTLKTLAEHLSVGPDEIETF